MNLSTNKKSNDLFSRPSVIFEGVKIYVSLQRAIIDLMNFAANNFHAQIIFGVLAGRLLKVSQHSLYGISHHELQKFLVYVESFDQIHQPHSIQFL